MAKRYDISTPRPKRDGGSYWVKIGSAWEGDKGIQLVFDALPIPDSEGRCVANLFEPRERQRSGEADARDAAERGGRQPAYEDLDDNVPF